MRVLLVQAFTALDMELVYPIGLAYLAAHLDGHAVDIFDLNLNRDAPYKALGARIDAFKPEVVGISLRNMKVGMPHKHTDDFQPQQETIEFIKERCPGITVIAGGTAFSLYAEAMMKRVPGIDPSLYLKLGFVALRSHVLRCDLMEQVSEALTAAQDDDARQEAAQLLPVSGGEEREALLRDIQSAGRKRKRRRRRRRGSQPAS